jgi:phosphatidylserine/phosphatidylglycerophosphate/cardiolipin synthase-like enzyme
MESTTLPKKNPRGITMNIAFALSLLLACFSLSNVSAACHVEAYFSNDDNLEKELIAQIDAEKKSIHIATYELGLPSVVEALKRAKKRGAEVEIVTDSQFMRFHLPFFQDLLSNQIPVLIWKFSKPATPQSTSHFLPIMHNKFFIFGGTTVWTGSYNLTKQATHKNAENAILIHDESLGKEFEEGFKALKADSFPYVPEKAGT